MEATLRTAKLEIASEIGADIGYFTPPDEKRFTGIEAMALIATPLLIGFLKGLASKLVEKVGEKIGGAMGEKIGEPIANFVAKEMDALFGKDKASQDKLLEETHNEALQKVQTSRLSQADLQAIAAIVQSEMSKALSQKMPARISERIVAKVREEALKTL